jgi:putative ABC transport system permease protein
MVEIQYPPGVGEQHVAVTMGPLAAALKSDFPEVLQSMRITGGGTLFVSYQDKNFNEENTAFADTNVFNMLSIDLLRGNSNDALQEVNSVVISEKVAQKYFGSIDDAIGKAIDIANEPFIVKGVMENMTHNSHIYFDLVMPFAIMESRYEWMRSWGSNSLDTYIELIEGTDQKVFESKLPEFIGKYTKDDWQSGLEMYIQPILDIHLKSKHIKFQTYNYKQGDISQVYIFSAIALLILIVACINYINLSTARAVKRSREVGIRKTAGAQREKLIFQFLGESIILVLLATIVAIILVELFLPYINQLLDISLKISISNWIFSFGLVGLIFMLGLVSGSYPAFYLSGFNPVKVLKGSPTNTNKGGSGNLRKVLVIVQFAISIIIIVSTLVSIAQVNYFHKKDKGYNDEAVYSISFHVNNDEQRIRDMELFKSELQDNPNILGLSLASGATGVAGSQSQIHVADSSETALMVRFGFVDDNYFEMMEIPLAKGRYFSNEYSTDKLYAVILNEIAVKKLGWDDPIGKEFKPMYGDSADINVKVVGVIKDYNYYSLLNPIEPAAYFYVPDRFYLLMIKINPNELESTILTLENKWNELFPKSPFDGYFMDDLFQYRYKNQINSMKVFSIFAVICILISCLGLYGLVAFIVTQRTKEVAIRKAIGSSSLGIVKLINKDFIKLILISSVIALPVSYYYMKTWLSNFVYRIDLSWYYFAIAITGALFIAIITNIFHTMRAALKNPADSLRYE